jgi:hypothetical protein
VRYLFEEYTTLEIRLREENDRCPMKSPTPLNEVMATLDRVNVCLRSLEELANESANKTAHQIAVLAAYELDYAQRTLQALASESTLRK